MTKYYKAGNSMKKQVATLMAAVATVGANGLLLGPMLTEVGTSLGTIPASVAWAMSAYGGGTAMSALLLAPLIDRIGERRALQVGMTVLFAAMLASATAGGISMLGAAQFLAGLGAGVVLPASYAMATLLAAPGKESATLGRVLLGWSLSLVAGVPVGAFIAEHVHWRASYFLLAAIAVAVGLLARRFPEQNVRSHAVEVGTSVLSVIRMPGVLPMLIIALVFTGSFYSVYAFVARETQIVLAVSTGQAGFVVFAFGTGFAIAALASHILDRWGARFLFPAILLANGAVYALMIPAMTSFPVILALAVVWGFFNHLCLNTIVLLLTRISPSARGALLGLNSSTTYLGLSLGTALAGRIYPVAGFGTLTLAAAILHFLAVAFSIIVRASARSTDLNEVLAPDTSAQRH